MSAREAALLTLVAMERQKAWSNGHLKKVIQEEHLDQAGRRPGHPPVLRRGPE